MSRVTVDLKGLLVLRDLDRFGVVETNRHVGHPDAYRMAHATLGTRHRSS